MLCNDWLPACNTDLWLVGRQLKVWPWREHSNCWADGSYKKKERRTKSKWEDGLENVRERGKQKPRATNYVHCLQQGLRNRAASLGGEVPEQSGPHLAVQNKNCWSVHWGYTTKEQFTDGFSNISALKTEAWMSVISLYLCGKKEGKQNCSVMLKCTWA